MLPALFLSTESSINHRHRIFIPLPLRPGNAGTLPACRFGDGYDYFGKTADTGRQSHDDGAGSAAHTGESRAMGTSLGGVGGVVAGTVGGRTKTTAA